MADCTELEWAIQVLVNNFDKYSSRCCCRKPRRISKKDFRRMLSCELNHMLTVRLGSAGTRGGQLLPHIWGPPHLAPPFPQHQHLRSLPQDTGNRRAADKLICDLDENKDGRISFEEYWTLIGGIASPIAHIIRQQEQSIKHTK